MTPISQLSRWRQRLNRGGIYCSDISIFGSKLLLKLLKAAAGAYDVLLTIDQNIPYQQNLGGLPIAILILAARRNSYARLKPLAPRALEALELIKHGEVIRIEA